MGVLVVGMVGVSGKRYLKQPLTMTQFAVSSTVGSHDSPSFAYMSISSRLHQHTHPSQPAPWFGGEVIVLWSRVQPLIVHCVKPWVGTLHL